MAAATVPGLKAGAAWYGRLTGSDDRPYPLTSVEALKAPVLGLYGGQDLGIPASDVEKMGAALASATNLVAKASAVNLYDDANHGFLADYRPSYNEAAAKDAWDRMMAHFKANI